jgi:hypothetical protein
MYGITGTGGLNYSKYQKDGRSDDDYYNQYTLQQQQASVALDLNSDFFTNVDMNNSMLDNDRSHMYLDESFAEIQIGGAKGKEKKPAAKKPVAKSAQKKTKGGKRNIQHHRYRGGSHHHSDCNRCETCTCPN